MKHAFAALSLAALLVSPLHAEDEMAMDPSCSDYLGMDHTGRMSAMEEMGDHMKSDGKSGDMATDGAMSPDEMMSQAEEACAAHPEGSVGDALKMMHAG